MVLSALRDGLRAAVSGDRRRLTEGGHNLDLSYVTPNIIGMGFPGSGVEGLYRNHISDVSSFFSERHSESVLVLNLSQRRYDYNEFGGSVLEFGFPDHHSPPLPLLLKACQEMHSWLQADEKNVVAVHCMAGKGRTGTVIASYLLFCRQCRTADEAFALFQETRTRTGVTMPSQRRYVHYMEQILPSWRQLGHLDTPPRVLLRRITVHTVPCFEASQRHGRAIIGSCRPAIQVLTAAGGEEASRVIFSSMHEQDTDALRDYSAPDDDRMDFEVMRPLEGDILVRCFHMQNSSANGLMSLKLLQGGGDTLAFRFAFHTSFLPSEGVMHLRREEVDDWEESGGHFSDDFRVELVYEHLPPAASAAAAAEGSPSVPPSSSSSLADPKAALNPIAATDAINGSREVQQQQHQGWLFKKGGYGSSELQRRWFVLRQKQQLLTYWKDPEDTRPKGSIPLAEITCVQALLGDDNDGSSATYKFSVATPGRTYVLVADSEAERTAWLELLHQKAAAGSSRNSPTEA